MLKRELSTFLLLFIVSLFNLDAQDLKVITFNVRYYNQSDGSNIWDLRKESALDFIRYEAPDFLGLQEAWLNQINDFNGGLKGYKWIGVGRDSGEQNGEFCSIFYNSDEWETQDSGTFWLSETPSKPSKSWDAAYPRICTWGVFKNRATSRVIHVFNTHFDHIGVEARKNSASLILKIIEEKTGFKNVILIGDFNLEPQEEPISILKSKLSDSFEKAAFRFGEVGTFNGFKSDEIPTARIDYVFFSKEFESKKYSAESKLIDGRFLSDHFPVIVVMKIQE